MGLASRGVLTSTPIPGLRSGFAARDAKIYLPPAYFSDPRPQLPVLVLLPGQPGTPQDWLGAGRLVRTMDAFAADRRGLTPVVGRRRRDRKPVRRPVMRGFTAR